MFCSNSNQKLLSPRPIIIRRRNYGSIDTEGESSNITSTSLDVHNRIQHFKSPLKQSLPYIWTPCNKTDLLLCIFILILERGVNLYVPILIKNLVNSLLVGEMEYNNSDSLESVHATVRKCSDYIFLFIFLKILQGGRIGGGILMILIRILWIPLQQSTTKKIQIDTYENLYKQNTEWNQSRNHTRDIFYITNGATAMNNIIKYLVLRLFPALADISIAVIFLSFYINIILGIIIFIMVCAYTATTLYLSHQESLIKDKASYYAQMKYKEEIQNAYSTNTEIFDEKFQQEESDYIFKVSLTNFLQTCIFGGGLVFGSFYLASIIAVTQVANIGDFVLFIFYMGQISDSLSHFSLIYSKLFKINTEITQMLIMMKNEPEIKNCTNPIDLKVPKVFIELKNIDFVYENVHVLRNVSFRVPTGDKIAILGESGSWSSSIVQLILRESDSYYGDIFINGQNIKAYTFQSLRRSIGVISSDAGIFNETIEYNIKYGQLDASSAQIMNAAKIAELHELIMSMEELYETKVGGAKGVQLNQWERLRIEIARIYLRDPPIIIFHNIFSKVSKYKMTDVYNALSAISQGRTCLILDTEPDEAIIDSNVIHLIQNGEIVETGTHKRLIQHSEAYKRFCNSKKNKD